MLRIDCPFHGAVVNERHGTVRDGGLAIRVEGACPSGAAVLVNGTPATVTGARFAAEALLTERSTEIAAECADARGACRHTVRVVWDRGSFPRYRVSIDDTSFSLREIARAGYGSIYDCAFYSMLRRLHREYGAKFSANLYYEADDGFRLPEFPARYRAEWEEAATWLGLTFHAYADQPDRPYEHASPERLLADLALVRAEIERFAGPSSWIPPTVIHWGAVRADALPALHRAGVRVLSGYFGRTPWGGYEVHYGIDDERAEYLSRNEALVDWGSGIVFSRFDLVINTVPLSEIVPRLERVASEPGQAEIMDLLTHEQYFFPHYPAFIPDHPARLETAIRWVSERGYRPVFLHEGFLGARAD